MELVKMKHTRVFKSLWESQKRINAFRGGARSSKTFSICQAIAYWLITGYFGKKEYLKGNFTVCRETLPSVRASVLKDFIAILHECHMYHKVEYKKTLLEFHFQGREVNFISTDDINASKLRGRQHSFVFINECTNVNREAWNQLIMRTENFAIIDYNPAADSGNWVRSYIEGTRVEAGDCKLDVSTYHDNIDNLPTEMIEEIEGYKHTDKDIYEVYAKGNWIKLRNLVYEKIHIIKRMPVVFDREFAGIDFGWNDPSVHLRVRKKDNNLYIEEIFHESKLGLDEMAKKMIRSGVAKTYCDHNPLLRMELKSRGVNVRNATKGKDSITKGIAYIRSHNIHILETSIKTIEEFRKYKYKLDEDGHATDDLLDLFSHAPDALRYALSKAGRSAIRLK